MSPMIRSGSDCALINQLQEDLEIPAERFLPNGRTRDVAMLLLWGPGALFSFGEGGGDGELVLESVQFLILLFISLFCPTESVLMLQLVGLALFGFTALNSFLGKAPSQVAYLTLFR